MRNIIIFILSLFLFSCVSPRLFKELEEKSMKCNEERDGLMADNEQLQVQNDEFDSKMDHMKHRVEELEKDSLELTTEIRKLKGENNRIQNRYDDLKAAQDALIRGNADETRQLLSELQETQEEMQEREDRLNQLERQLSERQQNLEELRNELESRNQRLVELEQILQRKDSAVNALKDKVTKALLGFENEGLSVSLKNGKVYVSLDEKLLFKTGSYAVDPKGERALKKLATVLEQNRDINITIEGHTDDVPYVGGGVIKDNWDLSVHRATAIVRILLEDTTIDPERLTASGRGEHAPINSAKTAAARQMNRRTEIILTPKLDELFRILDSN